MVSLRQTWNTGFAIAEDPALIISSAQKIHEKIFLLKMLTQFKADWNGVTLYRTGMRKKLQCKTSFTWWQLATETIVSSYIKWTLYIKHHCQFSSYKGLVLDFVNAYGHCTAHKVTELENIFWENMAPSTNAHHRLKPSVFILMCLHKDVWYFRCMLSGPRIFKRFYWKTS